MKKVLLKPGAMFLLAFVLIVAILLIFPLQLFDAEVSYNVGGSLFVEQTKLHLRGITDFGPGDNELKRVDLYTIHRYLTMKGWMMLGLLTIGFPLLIAYRSQMAKRNAQKDQQN